MPTYRCWDLDNDPECEEEGEIAICHSLEEAAEDFAEDHWFGNDHPRETRVRVESEGGGERADFVVEADTIIGFTARRA